MLSGFGRIFILVGVLFIIFGLLLIIAPKIPFLGHLPGDIYIKKNNFTFYFPIATSILVSILLSLLLRLFRK